MFWFGFRSWKPGMLMMGKPLKSQSLYLDMCPNVTSSEPLCLQNLRFFWIPGWQEILYQQLSKGCFVFSFLFWAGSALWNSRGTLKIISNGEQETIIVSWHNKSVVSGEGWFIESYVFLQKSAPSRNFICFPLSRRNRKGPPALSLVFSIWWIVLQEKKIQFAAQPWLTAVAVCNARLGQ